MLYGIDLDRLAPERAVKNIDIPILVIHGEDDTRIPTEHGVRVHEAAAFGSRRWIVPGTDHVEAFESYPEEYVDWVADYLYTQLSPEAAP